MGWLGELWVAIKGREAVDMIFVPDLDPDAASQPAFEADRCYVELYVDSLRLRNARKFTTPFHGVVYSFASLAFEAGERIKIPAISKPENLAQLDPGGIARVITLNKQMMGAIPWRGGQLLLELGLFSVKGDNLLTPVLEFVTDISAAAGVSFVGKIAPFAPLITKGMDMLAGQTSNVALEVGFDTTIELHTPGTHAIIASSKDGPIKKERLQLDQDRKLLLDGQPLKAAYCVFSVRRTLTKADYGEIPELKEGFAKLREAIRHGVEQPAKDALAAFRLTALTSPDLIREDARRLVRLAEEMMLEAFAAGTVSSPETEPLGPRNLAEVRLYA